MMKPERFQEVEEQGGVVDLSARAKFRLTGTDRVRYLNGQVTNDVRQATATSTLYACVVDVKGRISADVLIHSNDSAKALMLDAEPELREMLGPRLERYIIADDVELADVTEEWRLWHVMEGKAESSRIRGGSAGQGMVVLKALRFGAPGWDVWARAANVLPDAPLPLALQSILPPTCPMLSTEEVETLRVLRGVPRFPHELNAETFPPEARLDERAMSYTKGCYIGQEVLSRIRTTGKMPRELVRWQAKGREMIPAAGEGLFVAPDGEASRRVGIITSAAWHPLLERFVGLAYLKQGFAAVDSELLVGGDTPRIETKVNLLPFIS